MTVKIRAPKALGPAYLAYLAAFLNLSAIWINHHDLFARVHRVDTRLLVVNLAVLLVASVFPWPSAVVAGAIRHGNAHDQLVETLLYASIGFCVPVVFIARVFVPGAHTRPAARPGRDRVRPRRRPTIHRQPGRLPAGRGRGLGCAGGFVGDVRGAAGVLHRHLVRARPQQRVELAEAADDP